jgi:hypothetical protein
LYAVTPEVVLTFQLKFDACVLYATHGGLGLEGGLGMALTTRCTVITVHTGGLPSSVAVHVWVPIAILVAAVTSAALTGVSPVSAQRLVWARTENEKLSKPAANAPANRLRCSKRLRERLK